MDNNYDLLKEINKNKNKVILSTGMSNLGEIKKALQYLSKCEVILLHLCLQYKTKLNNISLLKKNLEKSGIFRSYTDFLILSLSVIAGATFSRNILHILKIKK